MEEANKGLAKLNKGSDKKEEAMIKTLDQANWDQFIAPAPMSIALLGQLILISAETDFSLQDKSKEVSFKHLKYPDSFRACLMQVSNGGYKAFNKAHTNMDQIRLYSGNVDGHVKTAMKILLGGTPGEVELMLPDALHAIENIADECVQLSTEAEAEFQRVMELICELLEACTRAKGQYEKDLRETQIAIEVLNKNKESIESRKEEAEKKKNKMIKQMQNAEKDFKKAMDSMPSTGDMIKLAFVGMVTDVARNLSSLVSFGGNSSSTGSSKQKDKGNTNAATNFENESSKLKILKKMPEINCHIEAINKLLVMKKDKDGNRKLDLKKIKGGSILEKIRQELVLKQKNLPENGDAKLRSEVNDILNNGVQICQELGELVRMMNIDDDQVENLIDRAKELSFKAGSLKMAYDVAQGASPIVNNPPHMEKVAQQQGSDGGGDMVNSAVQSARYKTETAKAVLHESQDRYDKSCEELDQQMKEYGNVLADLAKQDMRKIDFESIRKILIQGMKALSELQEKWGKLVQFFQMLSNLVKCSLESSLKSFASTTRNRAILGEKGEIMSKAMRDVLFEQAFEANKIAYVVNSISDAYYNISQAHLMPQVTCLGSLVALDPKTERREIDLKREELNDGCEKAQNAITRIAREKKREIDQIFERRIKKIQDEVEALMPPLAEEKILEIKEKAKATVDLGKNAIEEDVDYYS